MSSIIALINEWKQHKDLDLNNGQTLKLVSALHHAVDPGSSEEQYVRTLGRFCELEWLDISYEGTSTGNEKWIYKSLEFDIGSFLAYPVDADTHYG
jgi:hypothetical protein